MQHFLKQSRFVRNPALESLYNGLCGPPTNGLETPALMYNFQTRVSFARLPKQQVRLDPVF